MSKLSKILLVLLSVVLTLSLTKRAAAAGTCEQEVIKLCVSTTCPAFCAKASSDKAACLAGCTAKDRCRISLFGGHDRRDQVSLETEKRAQLMACLAENRSRIVVSEDLGAPKLPAPPAAAQNAQTKAARKKPRPLRAHKKATHGHVSNTRSRRTAWKWIRTESFRRRQAGKARINPVVRTSPRAAAKAPPRVAASPRAKTPRPTPRKKPQNAPPRPLRRVPHK